MVNQNPPKVKVLNLSSVKLTEGAISVPNVTLEPTFFVVNSQFSRLLLGRRKPHISGLKLYSCNLPLESLVKDLEDFATKILDLNRVPVDNNRVRVHTHRMSMKFWSIVASQKGYQTNVFHVYSEN